ncbi:MAG: DNA-directed RNA polymerase subunit K [Candidatus Nitrosopelagicus sp.]|jgi:DNA-directed RNA polymerase I, II, and III subunit RPABC2|nr:MAG: DNA-directed RNA polymerase subunit K [Candidatus Nitrosopelagicus sp.]|tara:strand:+ start:433 stop:1017 length:585 start_codon:yes stop_codon:yes gene_type:complete
MFGLYIGIFQLVYLSEPEETPITTEEKEEEPAPLIEEATVDEIIKPETEEIDPDAEVSVHATMEKAIENYKKIKEAKGELTEKEQDELEKQCEAIRQREIIDIDEQHEVVELTADGKILMGPPTLTRFEKARIMGARALQLSLGAPPFIDIPVSAATSLDISMKELEERVIPITIRRVLPNGDYQNIPLFDFKE